MPKKDSTTKGSSTNSNAESSAETITKMKRLKLKALGFGSAAILVLGIWFVVAPNIVLKNKILPNNYFGGIRLSSTPSEAKDQIWQRADEVKFKLSLDGQMREYSQADAGVSVDKDKTYQMLQAKSQQTGFGQKGLESLKKKELTPVINVDIVKLKDLLKKDYADGQAPEDARIEYSEDQGSFVVVEEKRGKGVEYSPFEESIKSRLASMSAEPIEVKIEEVEPEIKSTDLIDKVSEFNVVLGQSFEIRGPLKNFKASKAEIRSWLNLNLDQANKSYNLSLDQSKVSSFAQKAITANSRKVEDRVVANIDGGQIVLSEGSGGVEVENPEGFKAGFAAEAARLKSVSKTLEYKDVSPTVEDVAATNGRWIFADISQFKVYAYEGSNLVNSFSMSSGAPSTPTPPGRYSVMSKVRVKTMRGGTPGTRDYYEVPNIEWVAYFKSGGYAMHGVYWHNNFGVKNTSHGCMGMRNSDAQWVYDFVTTGTPVIIVP